jgi:hypothetical protein
MPQGQPYNTLGQIIAAGGEIGVASLLYAGADQAEITQYVEKRFGPVDEGTMTDLLAIAFLGLEGGEAATLAYDGGSLSESQIPIEPNLFGDDLEGRRFYWKGQFQLPGNPQWYDISGDAATLTEFVDQLHEIPAEALKKAKGSPKKLPTNDDPSPDQVGVRIVTALRAF